MGLDLRDVTIRRGGTTILDSVSWTVADGQRWVVLGPNGAGKTTLLQIASGRMHPTSGTATVLGCRLGAVDVFDLRPRVGGAWAARAGEGCRGNTHRWTQVEYVDGAQPTPQHGRGARGRVHPPRSDLEQRRLACAVGAEDHPPLPVGHGPRHRVEDGRTAAPDGHVPQIQHHAPTLTRRSTHPPSGSRQATSSAARLSWVRWIPPSWTSPGPSTSPCGCRTRTARRARPSEPLRSSRARTSRTPSLLMGTCRGP